MANTGKVLFVLAISFALLAVAFAADAGIDSSVLSAPRRMLKSINRRFYGGGWGYWPGTYGGFGGWMMPYQENRWVSAARMDTSVDRRFARATKK